MARREEVMKAFLSQEEETAHRVQNGIELHRKGYSKITVKDRNGNPLPGVKIRAKLKKHEFLHGANIFMLEEMETEDKNEKYRKYFKQCFNEATVPIYWNSLEPTEGQPRFSKDSPKFYRRPPVDLCLEYCEENNITPKAHCLTYMQHSPEWLDQKDLPGLRRKLERRYRELSERYAERISGWEVINELFCNNLERGDRLPYFADDRILEESFELAKLYFRFNELIINEASQVWEPRIFSYNRSDYYAMVENALRKGLRIDAVGMQFHVFRHAEAEKEMVNSLYNPKQIYRVLDQYAKLNLPMQITEITIPAYGDSKEDYALQAEILERLYRIWFSHPSVEAAIYWNLVDGYAWKAPMGDMTCGENYYRGGLLDFNLNPKPAYEALYRLFHEEWVTDTTCETDENGVAKFLGFYGEYELTVGEERKEINHSSRFQNHFEFIL